MSIIPVPLELSPKGFEQVTVSSSAIGLASIPTNFFNTDDYLVAIEAETNDIRYRIDGVDPTSSIGVLMIAGEVRVFTNVDLTNIKFIRSSADATVDVEYYGSR